MVTTTNEIRIMYNSFKPKLLEVMMKFHPNCICVMTFCNFDFCPQIVVCRMSKSSKGTVMLYFLYCFLHYKMGKRKYVLHMGACYQVDRKN